MSLTNWKLIRSFLLLWRKVGIFIRLSGIPASRRCSDFETLKQLFTILSGVRIPEQRAHYPKVLASLFPPFLCPYQSSYLLFVYSLHPPLPYWITVSRPNTRAVCVWVRAYTHTCLPVPRRFANHLGYLNQTSLGCPKYAWKFLEKLLKVIFISWPYRGIAFRSIFKSCSKF